MKINRTTTSLLTGLALAATLPLAAVAQSQSDTDYTKEYWEEQPATVFRCIDYPTQDGRRVPATVATRDGDMSEPLILWRTRYFVGYTPSERCQIVSNKFTEVVAYYGGSLQNLELTHGTVNGETVICVARFYGDHCNRDNMLFTLRPQNARRVAGILRQIEDFSQGYADIPPIEESSAQVYVNLSNLVDGLMEQANRTDTRPSSSPRQPQQSPRPSSSPRRPQQSPRPSSSPRRPQQRPQGW